MIRFYRSHGFEVFSTIDNETLLPEETIIEFKCDYLVKVNVKRLQRQLDKHIKSVKNYFIVVEEWMGGLCSTTALLGIQSPPSAFCNFALLVEQPYFW